MTENIEPTRDHFYTLKIDQKIDFFLRYANPESKSKMNEGHKDFINQIWRIPSNNQAINQDFENVVNLMYQEGLINLPPENSPSIPTVTLKGYRILENGGWLKYIEAQAEQETLGTRLIESNINTNRLVRRLTRFQAFLLVLTFIVTCATGWYLREQTNLQSTSIQQQEDLSQKQEQQQQDLNSRLHTSLSHFLQTLDSIEVRLDSIASSPKTPPSR